MIKKEKKKLLDQPQHIIQRWFAIKTIRVFRPFIEGIFLLKLRVTLTYQERKRKQAINEALKIVLKEYKKIQNTDYSASKDVFNIALFYLLAERDLQAIKIDAFSHPNKWKRNLSLRIMLLIIHERDISKVASGETMKNIYENTPVSNKTKDSTVSAIRQLNKAHKKTQKILVDMRNNTIAHREPNAMLQNDLIEKLDIHNIKATIIEYFEASNNFFNILPTLLIESGTLSSLVLQLFNKNEKH